MPTTVVDPPTLPPMQLDIDPESPSNSNEVHPPDEDQILGNEENEEQEEGENTQLAVAEPDQHERGTVAAITSARKLKYKTKKSDSNSTARHASKAKKHQIAAGKRAYVERRNLKYLFDVTSDAIEVIKLYPSDKFRFFGVCLGKAPSSKLY